MSEDITETLSEEAILELLSSKDKLSEFSTTALIHAITAGLRRVHEPDVASGAIMSFIETVRKVRADLTGDDHEKRMPNTIFNIQFGQDLSPREITVGPAAPTTSEPLKSAEPKPASNAQLLSLTENLLGSNIDDDSE